MKTFKIKLSEEQAEILYEWLTGFNCEERILTESYTAEEEHNLQQAITVLQDELEND